MKNSNYFSIKNVSKICKNNNNLKTHKIFSNEIYKTSKFSFIDIVSNEYNETPDKKTELNYFNIQNKNNKKNFFEEPQPYKFDVLNHHEIPEHIQRPNYVINQNFDYYNKKFSIHKTEQDIENHRKSSKITAKILKHIEDMSLKDDVS